jgi:hypothetical protein
MNGTYRLLHHLLSASIVLSVGLLFPAGSMAQEVVVDNDTVGTLRAGEWNESAGLDPYGANSLWGYDGAWYMWQPDLPATGVYEVYMWWTEYPSRSPAAPVTIKHVGGSEVVYVNQLENGGQWNLLGPYGFVVENTPSVSVTAGDPYPTTYCADAVRFVYLPGANMLPVADIDSVSPISGELGDPVTCTGSGTDIDGTVVGYRWRSSIDGELSSEASFSRADLSMGTHTIFFSVQDDDGGWSPEVTDILNLYSTAPGPVVVDNGDPGTSYTGTWETSAGTDPYGLNPYGTDSLYSRNGATHTWHAELPLTGTYDVYMWWTDYVSRSTRVPVTIRYKFGTGVGQQLLYISQLEGGGRWHLLGTWDFDADEGGTVTIAAEDPFPTSYCADAVMFIYVERAPPVPSDTGTAAVVVLILALLAKRHLFVNGRPQPERC